MTKGLLLDGHSLAWLNTSAPMLASAIGAIDHAGLSGRLHISHISYWELGVAVQKKNPAHRPDLGGLPADRWLKMVVRRFELRTVSISARVATEAALLPSIYGSGDPGDCFLIATAHIRNLALVTRDRRIQSFAASRPDYLSVISC